MFIGVVIAFIFFGLRTRRMGAKLNVSTFPQLLGRHFRSRNIQVFIAAVIFIGMPLYAAVVMKGGAVFIEQIFQIDFNISLLIFTSPTCSFGFSSPPPFHTLFPIMNGNWRARAVR